MLAGLKLCDLLVILFVKLDEPLHLMTHQQEEEGLDEEGAVLLHVVAAPLGTLLPVQR